MHDILIHSGGQSQSDIVSRPCALAPKRRLGAGHEKGEGNVPINSFEVHGLVVSRLILYDLAVEVKKNLVAYISLAGIGAVAALRKKTRSGAVGRADAGQT